MKSPRLLACRIAIATLLCSLFVAPLVTRAQPAARPGPRPAAIVTPDLDSKVIEGREKVKDARSVADDLGTEDKKPASIDLLEQRAQTGDLKAALKAKEARKEKGQPDTPAQVSALEVLCDKGIAAGDPDAFVAKAEIEWSRNNYEGAVKRLREASGRGSGAADFKLALFKAQKPENRQIAESPTTLLKRAGDKGETGAALALGLALDRGFWRYEPRRSIKVDKSPDEAVAWMERAALLGSDEAALWLGLYYMKAATGLTDVRRQQALEYLLRARKAGPSLKEPVSEKTFAALEAAGLFEVGLLGEIKRRENQEGQVVAANRADLAKKSAASQATTVGITDKRTVDHQVLDILGDPQGVVPVYNLVGLSPYKEIAAEGVVLALQDRRLVAANLPALSDTRGWSVDLFEDGKRIQSLVFTGVDIPTKSLQLGIDFSVKDPTKLRYRIVRHHSFLSTFGADNAAGLRPGTSGANADTVVVFDARLNVWRELFFHADKLRWVEAASGEPLLRDIGLSPGTAVMVKRTESGTLALQVRGMRPADNLDFFPAAGVSLVSIRKNALSAKVSENQKAPGIVAASDLFVLSPKSPKDSSLVVDKDGRKSQWWSDLGLRASDRLTIANGSAAVLVNR